MIISSFQSPNKSLYVIGGNIIAIIRSYQFDEMNPLTLFKKYNDVYGETSLSYVFYGLDWLFIVGAVSLTLSGDIILCN